MLFGMGVEGGVSGRLLTGVCRVLLCTVIGAQALCSLFLLLPEAGLLGGVQHVRGRVRPPPPIGELFSRSFNIGAAVERTSDSTELPQRKVLLIGGATPLFWEGDILYNTVFDRNPLGDALRLGGPPRAAQWLREQQVDYMVIDWREIERLRATYGFDDAITPVTMQNLENFAITRIAPDDFPGWTVLRIEKTR